jgi:hemoglobin/transferrin/lactoferrin receptor protein
MSTAPRRNIPAGCFLTSTLAAATALSAAPAAVGAGNAADSTAPEQVTVSATRIETKLSDVPATVSVLTAATIEARLVQDVRDLIRFEPGVAVPTSPARFTAAGSSTGRDGHSGFNIRGLEGNRVLMQVDGVRIADGYSFGAQSMGRGDYVDLDIVKAVEIVRGPASALYGSDGLAGAVTFLTRDPEDLLRDGRNWALKARAGYASADNARYESVMAAGKADRWSSLLAYTRRDGEGQETRGTNRAANIDRTVPNPQDDASSSVFAKLLFAVNDASRLRLTVDHLDRNVDWNVLSAVAKPPLASTSTLALAAHDELQRDRVSLDHRFERTGSFIDSAHTTVYWQQSQTRQRSSEERNTAADRTRDSTFDNTVRGLVVELTSALDAGGLAHRFVYGADYSTTRQEGTRDGTVPPVGETFPTHAFPTTDYRLAGVFVQDEITFGRVSVYPAVRWDSFEISPQNDPLFFAGPAARQSDSHVTPKLGMLMRLTERVNLFANAAAGFKAPAPSQVNNGFANPVQNYRSISNPDLKPETSRSLEAGMRVHGGRWSGSVAAFTGKYDDFIEQVQIAGSFTPTDPAQYQYINLSGVDIHGVEGKAQITLGRGFGFTAAASYARGESREDGTETALPSIEPLKIVSGLDWASANDRYGAELFAVHSQGKSASRAGVTCTPSCFVPGGFTVLDAVAWWKPIDSLAVRAGVFNLTNEKYWWWSDVRGLAATSAVKDAYSQPGRNVSVSVSMAF